LRGFDDKSLRAADFDQLLKIASYCIARSRTVSPERTDVFRAFLDFAFLCLRSDFLEKQLLATRIFALCIQLMERMEHYQAILTEWLGSNDVLELVAGKDLHEQVLSGLINPLKRLMGLKGPSEQHLTNLWGMAQRYGSGHVKKLLTSCIDAAGEGATLRFVDSALGQPVTKTRLEILQTIAENSCQEIAARIADFIAALLRDPEFSLLAIDVVRSISLRSTGLRALLLARSKQDVVMPDVPQSIVDSLTCLLQTLGDNVDAEFVTALVDALGHSPARQSL
jgi:hypothetical protein